MGDKSESLFTSYLWDRPGFACAPWRAPQQWPRPTGQGPPRARGGDKRGRGEKETIEGQARPVRGGGAGDGGGRVERRKVVVCGLELHSAEYKAA